jgi:hypothetical protein
MIAAFLRPRRMVRKLAHDRFDLEARTLGPGARLTRGALAAISLECVWVVLRNLQGDLAFEPRYNIAPSQSVPNNR